MSGAIAVPMTPELFEGMQRLHKRIERGDIPDEVRAIKANIARLTEVAEDLAERTGEVPHELITDIVAWKRELDGAYLRAAQAEAA